MITVAKILLVNSEEEILVLTRSDTHPLYPLHLDFPGGLVDPGELPEQAVVRELEEETGLIISDKDIVKIMETPNGVSLHLLYMGTIGSKAPDVDISWEHSSYEWIDRKELIHMEHPEGVDSYYADVIAHLRKVHHK